MSCVHVGALTAIASYLVFTRATMLTWIGLTLISICVKANHVAVTKQIPLFISFSSHDKGEMLTIVFGPKVFL